MKNFSNLPELLVNGGTGIQTQSDYKIHTFDHYFSLHADSKYGQTD